MKGIHITSLAKYENILEEGLKGSAWEEDFTESLSNPFDLYDDGAVFCWLSWEQALQNLCYFEADDVALEIEGEGLLVDHVSEDTILVLRADTCKILSVLSVEKISQRELKGEDKNA